MAKANNGWIRLYRSSFLNEYYFSETFTRWQAWTDLLLLANHSDGFIRVRGVKQPVLRGQVGYSMPTLANRWKWSKGKVIRFLNELAELKQIVLQKTNVTTLISIRNYHLYQPSDTADGSANNTANRFADGPQTGSQTDTNKNDNNNNKENNRGAGDFGEFGVSTPSPESVSGYKVLGNGEAIIEPTLFFYKDQFQELPKDNVSALIAFLSTTKQIEITEEKVQSLWEVFKTQELTEQKPYKNKSDVYRHFLNWSKKQTFAKTGRSTTTSRAKKDQVDPAEDKTKASQGIKNILSRYD